MDQNLMQQFMLFQKFQELQNAIPTPVNTKTDADETAPTNANATQQPPAKVFVDQETQTDTEWMDLEKQLENAHVDAEYYRQQKIDVVDENARIAKKANDLKTTIEKTIAEFGDVAPYEAKRGKCTVTSETIASTPKMPGKSGIRKGVPIIVDRESPKKKAKTSAIETDEEAAGKLGPIPQGQVRFRRCKFPIGVDVEEGPFKRSKGHQCRYVERWIFPKDRPAGRWPGNYGTHFKKCHADREKQAGESGLEADAQYVEEKTWEEMSAKANVFCGNLHKALAAKGYKFE